MSQSTQAKPAFFNLHTDGIGYLNGIREVKPKKGKPFLACRIAALTGASDSVEYRYFDVNVVGEDVEKLIRRCIPADQEKKKILINFRIADLWVDTFTYTSDNQYHKKGDVGTMLKGRLINILTIKIDGELKYQTPRSESQSPSFTEDHLPATAEESSTLAAPADAF